MAEVWETWHMAEARKPGTWLKRVPGFLIWHAAEAGETWHAAEARETWHVAEAGAGRAKFS